MELGLRQEEVGGRDTAVGTLFEEPGGVVAEREVEG